MRVQPLAGAAADPADVTHEGMCRDAAANAKEGCKELAKRDRHARLTGLQ